MSHAPLPIPLLPAFFFQSRLRSAFLFTHGLCCSALFNGTQFPNLLCPPCLLFAPALCTFCELLKSRRAFTALGFLLLHRSLSCPFLFPPLPHLRLLFSHAAPEAGCSVGFRADCVS